MDNMKSWMPAVAVGVGLGLLYLYTTNRSTVANWIDPAPNPVPTVSHSGLGWGDWLLGTSGSLAGIGSLGYVVWRRWVRHTHRAEYHEL